MKRALLILAALAAAASSQGFVAYYYEGNVARWDLNYAYHANLFNPATKAIKFYIGGPYNPNNPTPERNAIRAAFAQWQAIPGTVLKFEEAGLAPTGAPINAEDNQNVICFTTATSVNGGQDSMAGRVAVTTVIYDDLNRILEADIAMNSREFAWFTDYNNLTAASKFVETIALHEIGHSIGLDHTPVGGACIIDGATGISPAFGLSEDEIAAARFLYPNATVAAQKGSIAGTVRANGVGVFGAVVTVEDANGNVVQGTVSDTSGNYRLSMLAPGNYNVRVTPLDPSGAALFLIRGRDIAIDYANANTNFRPSENVAATVTAGGTSAWNPTVISGSPAFRIQGISRPVGAPVATQNRTAYGLNRGETAYVGVSGAFPADATFSISGGGITMGAPIYQANYFGAGTHSLQAQVTIAANAVPGLRTFVVRRGTDVAYANGYLEIYPPTHDYNFDGLEDRFQRQYWPVWTAPEAAPAADPDNDRFTNAFEAATGSNPTNAQSYSFLIRQVEITRNGARVSWTADVGKRYQVYSKSQLVPGATWQPVSGAVTAETTTAEVIDPSQTGDTNFYRLELLP